MSADHNSRSDMYGNHDNIIIPQRFVPFDIGGKIDAETSRKIAEYCADNKYEQVGMPGLLKNISFDVILRFKISVAIRLYIYSYGIGVFVLEDDLHPMDDKYAVTYCDYRKNAHKAILEFRYKEFSAVIKKIIDDIRRIALKPKQHPRPSAGPDWEYNGLSYVMTVSYVLKKDKKRKEYDGFTELEKKNLQIMLQPSIAHKEDTMVMDETEEGDNAFDPYNFQVERIPEPHNWIKSEDCAIYISWAAVVIYLKDMLGKYMDILECLEVDLQAMWLFTYCQYLNLKAWSSRKRLTSSQLKKEKYNFQRKFNEFISNNDSSIPVYIFEIRNELINTSGIDREKDNYVQYLDYCISETESYESEKQRKYAMIDEILLFLIAFIEIAPVLYDLLCGNFKEVKVLPIVIMALIVVAAVFFIIKKD